MRAIWIAAAVTTLAGCPGGGQGEPDGRPDATPAGGLRIQFASDQPVPGEIGDGRRLEEVRFEVISVRAIGDAAPGDERTTRSDYELRWEGSDTPEAIHFEQAPVGLYSSIEVRLAGATGEDDPGGEIGGEVLREAVWVPFEIETRDPQTVTIPTSRVLEVGETTTIPIDVDLASIITGIDFTEYPVVEGRIEIDGDTPLIRTLIREAFTAPDAGGDPPPT